MSGGLVAAPLAAEAQQPGKMYRIGLLDYGTSDSGRQAWWDAFRRRMRELGYVDGPRFPADFSAINARVLARPPGEFEQQIVISAGSADGVKLHAPVVTADGLVGNVTLVTRSASRVTLLTDASSAVAAVDLQTKAVGIVRHGSGGGLFLDRVSKDQTINDGDTIVTAGTQSGELPDLYPRGIQIGKVTSVGQSDTDLYKQIQVSAFVRFGSLDSVVVLRSLKPTSSLP